MPEPKQKGSIVTEKESPELYEMFHLYENCFFCGHSTDTWHKGTNQPVCSPCSKTHKVNELAKAHIEYNPKENFEPALYKIYKALNSK